MAEFLQNISVWGVALTLGAFALGTWLNKKTGQAIFNPLLLGSIFGGKVPLMSWCSLLSYVPLFWCIFRMYSRNIEARRRENAAFVNFFNHLKDKEHRYFRCPRCHQTVRVPRGRGKINIRCPKCSERFIKTT